MLQQQNIQISGSGDHPLVAAQAGKRIRVVSVFLMATGAASVYFESNTTPLCGGTTMALPLAANGGFVLPAQSGRYGVDYIAWFETGLGEALQLNLAEEVGLAGTITYEVE